MGSPHTIPCKECKGNTLCSHARIKKNIKKGSHQLYSRTGHCGAKLFGTTWKSKVSTRGHEEKEALCKSIM